MKRNSKFKNHFGKNKKGGLLDTIFIAVSILIMGVFIIFGYKIITATNDKVQTINEIPDVAKTAYNKVDTKYVNTMDTGFIILWLASFLGALISAWFIDTHPFFFVLSIFVLIPVMVAIVPLSNVFESILSSDELANEITNFPIIMWFSQHYFTIILVQSFMILFSLYGKLKLVQ